MPFDLSGNFTRVHGWVSDRDNNIKIIASRMDAEFDNYAAGMNMVFFRNGNVPMSGNLNMGLNYIQNIGAGSAAAPAFKFGDDPNSGIFLDGVGKFAFAIAGVKKAQVTSGGFVVSEGNLMVGQNNSALQSGGTGITISGTSAAEVKFLNSTTGNTAIDGTALVLSSTDFLIVNREAGSVSFSTNNTQRMVIASNGDVSIVGSVLTLNGSQVIVAASPAFTGTPTAPTAANGTNTTQLATTAFVQSQLTATLVGYATTGALASYAPLASPALTGTPTSPTASTGTNTTQLATTAFVQAQLTSTLANYSTTAVIASTYAPLASPALTGTPTAPTAATVTNTTQIATTAYVKANLTSYATLAAPALTGVPTTPTAANGTNTTQIASTAFVQSQLTATLVSYALLASPTFTGTPAGPTASTGTNTTQFATTAFVQAQLTSSLAAYAPLASPALTGTPTTGGIEIGFRSIPRSTTTTTLAVGDRGKCVAVSANIDVPNSVFAAGDAVSIYNDSASAVTVTQGSGVTLRLAGTTTTGSRTLAPRGLATIWFNSASEAIMSGGGVT